MAFVATSLRTLPRAPSTRSPPPQLSADQIGQLYELMQASKNVWMTQEELDAELQRRAEEEDADGIPSGERLPDLAEAHKP